MTKEEFWDWTCPEPNTGCLLWMGAIHKTTRYGIVNFEGKTRKAHRVAFELSGGDLSPKLDCCHKCDNRGCVNPEHLFMGTRKENMDDCIRKGRAMHQKGLAGKHQRDRTHCGNGHEFNETNTKWYRGYRVCRVCAKINSDKKNFRDKLQRLENKKLRNSQ